MILSRNIAASSPFETAQATPPAIAGALNVSGIGKEWTVLCNGARNELPAIAAKLGADH
jgi:ABC-2 type transport system ATP-binding protein